MADAVEDERKIVIGIAITFLLLSVGIVGWQIFSYLRFDMWHSISLITTMQWLQNTWALSPVSWFGLFKVLDFIPLSLASLVFGVYFIFLSIE